MVRVCPYEMGDLMVTRKPDEMTQSIYIKVSEYGGYASSTDAAMQSWKNSSTINFTSKT